jgi:hypothetical protein
MYLDVDGRARFQSNLIVRHLLDTHPDLDLNALIVREEFTQADWEQFAQLIGYSLNGFGELSYVSDETYAAAATAAEEL